ncbi:hypothetical protein ADEAN_000840300 [Angomonas deanei]|uniref:Uncharacterized protein n=1 Tax=Angomonas deanei TaxID=59799 RepID=A0A7G2CNG4_9TRYP|nr:hypothetical protein ADEAN_000840300 [Angomonas deanei]
MNRLLWKHACLPPSAAGGDSASEASSVSGSEAEGGAEDSPTKGLWFLAMIEGGRHSCPHAAKLLVRFVNSSNSEAHTNMVNKAGVSLAGTLLLLASSSLLAAIRIEVVRTLPLLQRMSPRAAQFMRSPKDSLPLLARVLKRDGSHTILGEEILKNICTLCEEEKMATNAAQSAIFCRAVVRCLVNNWRNTTLFSLTRRLCELLYGHTAPTTAEFFPLDPSALQPTEQIPPELLAKV